MSWAQIADVFWFGVSKLMVPLAVWSGVFTLAAAGIGVPTAVWCARRTRRARASGRLLSTPRILLLWLFAATGLFAIPAVVAVVHAVPFAIERGLAQVIERSAPEAAEWVTDLASTNVASLLGVGDEQTLLHVRDLEERTAAALDKTRAAASSRSGLARVQYTVATMCLRAVHAALAEAGPTDGRISWRDLSARTKTVLARSASAFVAETVMSLHLAAWTNVVSALAFVVLSHLMTVVVFFLLVRPMIQSEPELKLRTTNSRDATNRQDNLSRDGEPRRPEAGTAVGHAIPDRSRRSSLS